MGERQFGPYRLVRQIAVGGMAEIHLAKTKGIAGFEKYVALKMIHPNFAADEQFIQMLVDEAKIAVQLNHGNIAQTFDLGRVGDTYYITMEYVDGADLYKILRRGSEMDVEIPLDVCAFVGKEIASALDHAHRKRDHTGRTLGIVHRDVSPQNVLVSYAGEIKLVDFGIAKATMKARQTAVGVIKGKYYYMSPEQAWGDQVDYRSDIFSAGIVLYEMITGQMLYLEEDLNKLIDMARKADIALPSTLRAGVPPQLERIVMHALAKDRRDRYQSASDFATDLERFLHGYSPVFTASKVVAHVKGVIGSPAEVPEAESIEERDGPLSTHTLGTQDLVMDKEELQDENSVIFRVADLRPKKSTAELTKRPRQPTGGGPSAGPRVRQEDLDAIESPTALDRKKPRQPTAAPVAGPRVTRQASFDDIIQPTDAEVLPFEKQRQPTPPAGARKVATPSRPATVRPRDAGEETRQVAAAPPSRTTEDSGLLGITAAHPGGVTEDSGLLGGVTTASPKSAAAWRQRDADSTQPGVSSADTGGDHTMISDAPLDFLSESTGEDGVDATMISRSLGGDETTADVPDVATNPDIDDISSATLASLPSLDPAPDDDGPFGDDDGPTIQRDFRDRSKPKAPARAAPPAALAAKIHAPAVSELRKPRASRRTPGAGTPQPNILQAIVSSNPAEPMPTPRPGAMRIDVTGATPGAPPPPASSKGATLLGTSNASAFPQPPTGFSQSYAHPPSGQFPPGAGQGYPPSTMTPSALYPMQPPYGAPPQALTLTGQMRLLETDEIGDRYKVGGGGGRGIKIAIAGIASVALAALVTFLIIKTTRDSTPTVGRVRVESTPAGAQVVYDGVRLADATPMTIDSVPIGTRHDIRVELPRHQAFTETADIPKRGGTVTVTAVLGMLTGKIVVNTQPGGAEIRIDGQPRGIAPTTIEGLDMSSTKKLELRLKDHDPVVIDLTWPDNGAIKVDQKLMLRP